MRTSHSAPNLGPLSGGSSRLTRSRGGKPSHRGAAQDSARDSQRGYKLSGRRGDDSARDSQRSGSGKDSHRSDASTYHNGTRRKSMLSYHHLVGHSRHSTSPGDVSTRSSQSGGFSNRSSRSPGAGSHRAHFGHGGHRESHRAHSHSPVRHSSRADQWALRAPHSPGSPPPSPMTPQSHRSGSASGRNSERRRSVHRPEDPWEVPHPVWLGAPEDAAEAFARKLGAALLERGGESKELVKPWERLWWWKGWQRLGETLSGRQNSPKGKHTEKGLNKLEFHQAVSSAFGATVRYSEEEIDAFFRKHDTDESGILEMDELLWIIKELTEGAKAATPGTPENRAALEEAAYLEQQRLAEEERRRAIEEATRRAEELKAESKRRAARMAELAAAREARRAEEIAARNLARRISMAQAMGSTPSKDGVIPNSACFGTADAARKWFKSPTKLRTEVPSSDRSHHSGTDRSHGSRGSSEARSSSQGHHGSNGHGGHGGHGHGGKQTMATISEGHGDGSSSPKFKASTFTVVGTVVSAGGAATRGFQAESWMMPASSSTGSGGAGSARPDSPIKSPSKSPTMAYAEPVSPTKAWGSMGPFEA